MAPALGGSEMFDKLIETEPEGANFRDRRAYFLMSSLIVGVLFGTAVVISIYAADYGLGNESLELSMIVAPPDVALPELKPPQPHIAANPSQPQTSLPAKPMIVAPMDRTKIALPPSSTSTTDNETIRDPPRDTKPVPAEEKPKAPVSIGVANGKATSLPKPPYPAAALAMNIQGTVDVQVMIDESGKVTSAKAVTGSAFFRASAERAAWSAKFTPTYLDAKPVKVTGVIVYNFTRH